MMSDREPAGHHPRIIASAANRSTTAPSVSHQRRSSFSAIIILGRLSLFALSIIAAYRIDIQHHHDDDDDDE